MIYGSIDVFLQARRDARAVEWGGLENRCPPAGGPRVRIPVSPQRNIIICYILGN